MTRLWKRLTVIFGVLGALFVMALPAFAETTTTAVDPSVVLTDAASDLSGSLVATMIGVLPYVIAVLTILIGFRIMRRFFAAR
jgi:hypothetical protein